MWMEDLKTTITGSNNQICGIYVYVLTGNGRTDHNYSSHVNYIVEVVYENKKFIW